MLKLLRIIQKNFQLLLRSKMSALIIFIGPLLLVCLLGLAFSNSSAFLLTASIYSENYTDLAQSTIEKMEGQNFKIIQQDSLDECITSVKMGESQSCIVFPADMTITPGKTNELTFYMDYTQINLVWIILEAMTTKIDEKTEELSTELVTDLLERMIIVEEKITETKSKLKIINEHENKIKELVLEAKEDVSQLDISVDFNAIDFSDANQNADDVLDQAMMMKKKAAGDIKNALNKANSALIKLTALEAAIDDNETQEDIGFAIDKIEDIQLHLNQTEEYMNLKYAEIESELSNVTSVFSTVKTKLDQTKAKIKQVGLKRDEIMPILDNTTAEIDTVIKEVYDADALLTTALEKLQAIEIKEAGQIVSPITSKLEPLTTQKSHFHSLFPTLVVIVVMITGILLSSTIMMVEKKSRSFFRNAISPTNYFTFNLANYVSTIIILIMQLALFLSVAMFYFHVGIIDNIGSVLLIIFLAMTMFITLGILIGFLFKTEETVTLASITIASGMMLFSNAIIPLESMPEAIKQIAMYNPFVIIELALKKAIMFGFNFQQLLPHLKMVGLYTFSTVMILVILHTALKKLALMHFHWFHFGEKKGKVKVTSNTEKPLMIKDEPKKTEEIKTTTETKIVNEKQEQLPSLSGETLHQEVDKALTDDELNDTDVEIMSKF
ncbi:ABC transporter permease [Candidatus Woesearchaeota archaeon]|nr:ABC transporter permease [Candidatus Woesearchaeota archaeon]MBT6520151.1 ABC transporter permease [Candidatus Woesearchaeota archaeon]